LVDVSLKNFSYVALNRIIGSGSVAIFYIIIAGILEPEIYGMVGFFIALAATSSILARFGIPQTIVVLKGKNDNKSVNQLNFLAVLTACSASIILLFFNQFVALLCLGMSFFFLYQHNLLGEKKYKSYLKNGIFRHSLIFILPLVLYFLVGVDGIIIGFALGNIFASFSLIKKIKIKNPFFVMKDNYKILVNNFSIDSSTNLIRTIDRLLVGSIFGFGFVGVYIFTLQLLFAFEILPRVLYLFLLSEESSGKTHRKINYLVILTSVIIIVLVYFFSPLVIDQFFPKYSEGIMALQIMVFSLLPFTLSMIMSAKMQATKSTKVGFSGIINIGSLLILLSLLGSQMGLLGLSIAVVLSSIINFLFLFYLFKKPQNWKKSHFCIDVIRKIKSLQCKISQKPLISKRLYYSYLTIRKVKSKFSQLFLDE